MSKSTRSFIVGGLALMILAGCATTNAAAPSAADSTLPAPAASVPVSNAPSTSDAPTTTTIAPADEVIADFDTARAAREHCSVDPSTCDFPSAAIPGSAADE